MVDFEMQRTRRKVRRIRLLGVPQETGSTDLQQNEVEPLWEAKGFNMI